jgi:hypothetical protein
MMLQRPYLTILFAIALCFCFMSSCKKKDGPIPLEDFPFSEKKFYCQSAFNESNTSGSTSGSIIHTDIVLKCTVENDSLKVLGFSFPMMSGNQMSFLIDNNNSGLTEKIEVIFSDNYDSIFIEHRYTNNYNYSSRQTYTGVVSSLRESILPHAYQQDLEGNYLLQINSFDECNAIDTAYTNTFSVLKNNHSIQVGTENYTARLFHSYYREEFHSPYDSRINTIYWQTDSLSIDFFTEISGICSSGRDTVHQIYQGRKQ